MSDDVADLYEHLRQSTARMLALDLNALSPADEVKIGRTAGLRLEHDRLLARQLHGEVIDARVLVEVSELLEGALRPAAHATPEARFGANHRQKLRALIERTLMAPDLGEVERLRDVREREERVQADEACGRPPEPVSKVPLARPREAAAEDVARASSPIVNEGAVVTLAPVGAPMLSILDKYVSRTTPVRCNDE